MVKKTSDRNIKKQTKKLASQSGSGKKVEDMTLQERKQNIQGNGEQIKGKIVNMFESVKDNVKGIINLYIREILTQEDKIEQLTIENKELKGLLTKHKIKF